MPTSSTNDPSLAPPKNASADSGSRFNAALRHAAAFVLLFFLCGASERPIEIAYAVRDDVLQIDFNLTDRVTESFLERVQSGLTAVLAVHVMVLPTSPDGSASGPAESTVELRCEVRYDLWGEAYRSTFSDGSGEHEQKLVRTTSEALASCLEPGWLPIVAVNDLDLRRRYSVRVIMDMDPDRPRARQRTREYLADPGRAGRGDSGGRSLFGTMARVLFRQRSEEPDPMIHLRGVPFGEPLLTQALEAAERLEAVRTYGAGEEEEE